MAPSADPTAFSRPAKPAFLGLGSNLGDREACLVEALEGLAGQSGLRLLAISSCYETSPRGGPAQPFYLNLACAIQWTGTELGLLETCQAVEKRLGRIRLERWGPRTIDIDILLMGPRVILQDRLLVPHPHLEKRAFVLVPLAEIAGDTVHPVSGQTMAELLANQAVDSGVCRHPWRDELLPRLRRLGKHDLSDTRPQ